LVGHQHVVLVRRPVDPGIPVRHLHPPLIGSPSQRPDLEVPLRMLIDKALTVRGYVLLPLAAPHHRRDGLVFGRPSTKGQAIVALSRRRSRQTTACPMSARGQRHIRRSKAIVRNDAFAASISLIMGSSRGRFGKSRVRSRRLVRGLPGADSSC
jgi:hypothetical protein